mgnify:CR=1 FL=1
MKQWVYISLMLLSTVFLFSCKDDELENINVEDRMPELTLKFTEAEISRTSLNSSEPLQHVENVKLYIYEMKASTVAEGTPENAEQFVQRIQGATLCAIEILPWKNQSTSSGVSMSYKIQTTLEPGGEYVFLAVGTDAESEENYEFPTTMGATFGSAQARFKCETLSEQELREKMAKSEFFSGYQVAKLCSPNAGSKSILIPLKKDDAGNYSYDDKADQTTVELTRAVAGVLLYMTDIPARWNKPGESGDGYRVTKVKLRLHRMPASSVSLCGQSAGTGGSTEAGTEKGPVLIESMDLSELQFPSEGDLYQIVGQKGEVQTLDNTLLYGAYLLPVAPEAGKATFILELWGKACDEAGTIKDGAKEMELDDFECILENTASSDFAIERNHVYCIGQKPVADDTEGDAPVSLAGKEIVVDVQDWTPISDVIIEFPYVDTNAKFNPDFDPGYIFNCINASFTLPIVCNSNSKWQLSVPDDCDWLYIQQTDGSWDNTYTKEKLTDPDAKSNSAPLTLFIMDYAEYRASYDNVDINNDVRSVDLELRTMGDDGAIVKTTTLEVKQYNAISVTFKVEKGIWPNKYEDSYGVGFSRLDLGDEFYKTKEEAMADFGDDSTRKWEGVAHTPVNSRKAYGWGYWSSYDIFRGSADEYIGKSVIQDLRTGVSSYIDYWGENIALSEAITFCPKEPAEITGALNYDKSIYDNIKNSAYDFWYLPSEKELENFMYLAKKTSSFNLLEGGWYWIVNEEDVKNNQSYAFQYSLLGSLKKELKNRKCGTQVSDFDNEKDYDEQYGTQKIFIRPCLSFGIVSTTKK